MSWLDLGHTNCTKNTAFKYTVSVSHFQLGQAPTDGITLNLQASSQFFNELRAEIGSLKAIAWHGCPLLGFARLGSVEAKSFAQRCQQEWVSVVTRLCRLFPSCPLLAYSWHPGVAPPASLFPICERAAEADRLVATTTSYDARN